MYTKKISALPTQVDDQNLGAAKFICTEGGLSKYATGSQLQAAASIGASFVATPTSANLQSLTEIDIFNETVSLGGTRTILFKISYYAGGGTTNEWKLYVGATMIDHSNLALSPGFSGVATLMASSSALGNNATIRVTNKVNSGNVTKTLVNTAKLIII